jgi:hypothetical protein
MRRCQDDAPAVTKCSACRAASPATYRITDRNGADSHARARRHIGRRIAEPAARKLPKEPLDPSGKCIGGPTAAQYAISPYRSPRQSRIPVKAYGISFNGNGRTWNERFCRCDRGQLLLDPIGLLSSPFQCGPPAHPPGISQQQQPATFVDPQPDGSSSGMGTRLNRPGESRQAKRFRFLVKGACRQDAIPDHRHRLR